MNPAIRRILVVADRPRTSTSAVEWATLMAERYGAELVVLEVLPPPAPPDNEIDTDDSAEQELALLVRELTGTRGRPKLVYDSDSAQAIVRAAAEEAVDVVVVGNSGMRGRKEFRPGSVANRVSHSAHCTVIVVETTGSCVEDGMRSDSHSETAAGRDGPDRGPVEGELLGRAIRIAHTMVRHGLPSVLSAMSDENPGRKQARRLRAALDELGPAFAKLGQMLSTRPDLIGAAFVEELAILQDHVTPLTEAEVVSLMERELGMPWEDVFESLEPEPVAAGTIAQVHRATLAGGDRVVVKVQRPNAHDDIVRDLKLLTLFAKKAASHSILCRIVDLPAMVEQLSSSLRQELDFRNEARSIERMRSVLAPFSKLDVPRVHADLSTRRLLVMEEVQGVPLRQAPPGDARSRAARQLVESYYEQLLTAGFFHADPHPGNLMWCNDTIYFLDLGMTGQLPKGARELLLRLLLACWQEDAAFLAEVMLGSGSAAENRSPNLDEKGLQEDLADLIGRHRHSSLNELRLGPLFQQLTQIAFRYGIALPASLALVGKALGQMQFSAASLDPSLDPFAVAASFFSRRITRELDTWTSNPSRLFYQAQKLKVRAERLMRAADGAAAARLWPADDVESRRADRLEQTLWTLARRLGLAVTAGSALIGTVLSAGLGRSWLWLTVGVGATGAGLVTALLADVVWRPGK
jgi:ubiquinone biosynthesis protein